MKPHLQWSVRSDEANLHLDFSFENPEPFDVFVCLPEPPYVEITSDRRVRIWYGLYVLGEKDIVEAPVVPPVVLLKENDVLRRETVFALPLDESHPFPRYEHEEKTILESAELTLEIGYFSYDEAHLPPAVGEQGQEVRLAPYDWAAQTIRYVRSDPSAVAVPINMPRKLLRGE